MVSADFLSPKSVLTEEGGHMSCSALSADFWLCLFLVFEDLCS